MLKKSMNVALQTGWQGAVHLKLVEATSARHCEIFTTNTNSLIFTTADTHAQPHICSLSRATRPNTKIRVKSKILSAVLINYSYSLTLSRTFVESTKQLCVTQENKSRNTFWNKWNLWINRSTVRPTDRTNNPRFLLSKIVCFKFEIRTMCSAPQKERKKLQKKRTNKMTFRRKYVNSNGFPFVQYSNGWKKPFCGIVWHYCNRTFACYEMCRM